MTRLSTHLVPHCSTSLRRSKHCIETMNVRHSGRVRPSKTRSASPSPLGQGTPRIERIGGATSQPRLARDPRGAFPPPAKSPQAGSEPHERSQANFREFSSIVRKRTLEASSHLQAGSQRMGGNRPPKGPLESELVFHRLAWSELLVCRLPLATVSIRRLNPLRLEDASPVEFQATANTSLAARPKACCAHPTRRLIRPLCTAPRRVLRSASLRAGMFFSLHFPERLRSPMSILAHVVIAFLDHCSKATALLNHDMCLCSLQNRSPLVSNDKIGRAHV